MLPWRSREAPLPPRPRLAPCFFLFFFVFFSCFFLFFFFLFFPWFLALGREVGASWRIQHHFQLLPSSEEGFGPRWMSPETNFAPDLTTISQILPQNRPYSATGGGCPSLFSASPLSSPLWGSSCSTPNAPSASVCPIPVPRRLGGSDGTAWGGPPGVSGWLLLL